MSAVSDYFRTALLIDDRVAADYRSVESTQICTSQGSGGGLVEPPKEDETPVRPAELVRAFLSSGVVCSVLEAAEDWTLAR